MNQDNITNENIKIQGLLESYLRFRSSAAKDGIEAGSHLDEDGLAAFVDGNLTRRENESFIAHLVECSFCLHKTAELTELRSAFEEEVFEASSQAAEPVKVSEVLSNLFSRLFGSSDGVVFAHEEKKEDQPSTNGSAPPEDETKS
ncbi:MAG TPA: hypothetical protein VGO50_06410 [Pyrinomonadaceae bacterium]|jgi:hypothetical protein|nr:hypothetical protein [Pyrinomonadaceae bacterium]